MARSTVPAAGTDVRRPACQWFKDAKLGIFVHWGLYSVPAFADPAAPNPDQFMRDLAAMKDTGGQIPYAEWYLNGLRIPGSATAVHHAQTYGEEFSYFDFQGTFDEHVTRHLDVHELVDRYRPSVLWNDIGWPVDADLGSVLRHFYDVVEDGVVNDRWSNFDAPAQVWPHDFRTFEYEFPAEPPAEPWEMTRALGRSFGYNAAEDSTGMLDGEQLIDLLSNVVARAGPSTTAWSNP